MRDYVNVEKSLIPYGFDIFFLNDRYRMEFNYNKTEDLITVTLSKDGEILVYNEPLIYGSPLFEDIYKTELFPMLNLVPIDESGVSRDLTYENFGKTVFLTVEDE